MGRRFVETDEMRRRRASTPVLEPAADNGLLHRRAFIAGAALAGAAAADPARAEALAVEPWMTTPGAPFTAYGQPSRFEANVARVFANPPNAPGSGASRTPLHRARGHDHAQRPAFRAQPQRRPGYRSGQAPPARSTAWSRGRWSSRSRRSRAIRWSRASPSSNAAAIARCSISGSRSTRMRSGCTASSPAPNGPACRSSVLLDEAGVDPAAHVGCSPKAPTPPA